MVRTQIQIPDDLYEQARQLANAKEISLAELTRRGLEYMISIYPAKTPVNLPWKLPEPKDLGWRGLSDAQVRDAALDDMEARMPKEAR
jgi:hypothetical protein